MGCDVYIALSNTAHERHFVADEDTKACEAISRSMRGIHGERERERACSGPGREMAQ